LGRTTDKLAIQN